MRGSQDNDGVARALPQVHRVSREEGLGGKGGPAAGTYVALLLDGALAVLVLGLQHQVERAGLLVHVRLAVAPLAEGGRGTAGGNRAGMSA